MDTKLEVTSFLNQALKGLKKLNTEIANLLEVGLSSYMYTQTSKFYYVNTFLHRGIKKRFFDIYFPIRLVHGNLVTDFQRIEDIFDEYQYISILGSAGCGKSTLTKFIFLNSIQNRKRIPVLVEFRAIADGESIEEHVKQKLLNTDAKPSREILHRSLKKGNFLFIFDGFDEIYAKNKQTLNYGLDKFLDKYSKNYFIITSRPGAGIENYPRFSQFKVVGLKKDEIRDFVIKMVSNEEKQLRILDVLGDTDKEGIKEYLANPLLLSMFILSFENHPEIPKKMSVFYRNVFDTLYSRHDGLSKNSYNRERISGLTREDFEKLLQRFCYLTFINGQFLFTEEFIVDTLNKLKPNFYINFDTKDVLYDLVTSISIISVDGFEYSFPHRSLQEFFAAWFLKELPPEIKSKKLGVIHENLFNSVDGQSKNIWHLCMELDEQSFLKYFIVPNLKKFLDKAELASLSSHNFFNFLESSEDCLFFSPNTNKKETKSDQDAYLSVHTAYGSMLSEIRSLVSLPGYHFILWNFIKRSINDRSGEAHNEFWLPSIKNKITILRHEPEKQPEFLRNTEVKEHLFKIFKKYGLIDEMELQIDELRLKVSQLEDSISTYLSDLDDLLKFET